MTDLSSYHHFQLAIGGSFHENVIIQSSDMFNINHFNINPPYIKTSNPVVESYFVVFGHTCSKSKQSRDLKHKKLQLKPIKNQWNFVKWQQIYKIKQYYLKHVWRRNCAWHCLWSFFWSTFSSWATLHFLQYWGSLHFNIVPPLQCSHYFYTGLYL